MSDSKGFHGGKEADLGCLKINTREITRLVSFDRERSLNNTRCLLIRWRRDSEVEDSLDADPDLADGGTGQKGYSIATRFAIQVGQDGNT